MYRRWLEGEVTIAPPASDGFDFDTKMMFILAALLCSVIAAMGLNLIIRCTWRLGLGTEGGAAATGLKKEDLRRIPVEIYGSGKGDPETECPICLGEVVDGEKVRVLPKCNHGFHVCCIDTWLRSHSSCPTCRRSVIDHNPGSTSQRS